ncbi:MAG TPA: hypothetical protein VF199_08215 [Bacillales bacterium]
MKNHSGHDFVIPAVIQFEKEGVWTLKAYANKKQIGSVTIGVYEKPSVYKATSFLFKDHTVFTLGGQIRADWQNQNGVLSVKAKPHIQIKLREPVYKKEEPFPIIIMGIPITKGDPFIQAFSKSEVVEKGYVVETTLPIKKKGKWRLAIFAGDYPLATNVTFFVR